jgi:asparagine synthase (glutamine-hydrolysing)
MCGIAGFARHGGGGVSVEMLGRMAAAIRHRGPDGYGFFTGARVGLAHVRLSIVDVAAGAQPMTSDDGRIVVTYNGEIYNHIELRRELERHGHTFRTRCDTEILVHAFEEWGPDMLQRLNGQFAFALYDRLRETVLLARDRFGVRPLFFAQRNGDLFFGSEVKALLATGEVSATLDPRALDEVFTFWAVRAPRTVFAGIAQLEPGTYGVWRDGALFMHRYYELDYPEADIEPRDVIEQLDEIMRSAVGMRLRADVPVGAYLSGGLDSSITASLAAAASPHTLRTFSITFDDPQYDESSFQRSVAESLGSRHAVAAMSASAIASTFPCVIRHAETPLLRTAPVPMYHLAKLTRDAGIKVVLSGEGADELFLGYDLFKEVSIRRFCMRQPDSTTRPRLLDRLYPYLTTPGRGGEFWRRSFLDASPVDDPLFSHLVRFQLGARAREFYSPAMRDTVRGVDVIGELRSSLPTRFFGWSPLNQASYLEMTTLLSSYLLSSQGDRMGMAHGIETRFPFLDHRLFEFAAALPTSTRMIGLKEKEVLRRWAARILPPSIRARGKQPYRAPDASSFFSEGGEWVQDLLTPEAVARVGVFEPAAVAGLLRRCRAGRATGFRENQALVGVLSTQLWHQQFVEQPLTIDPLPAAGASVLLDGGITVTS